MNLLGFKQVLEAVAIAALTALCTKTIEHFFNKLKKDDDKEETKKGGDNGNAEHNCH